jgi:hypothetical protein
MNKGEAWNGLAFILAARNSLRVNCRVKHKLSQHTQSAARTLTAEGEPAFSQR